MCTDCHNRGTMVRGTGTLLRGMECRVDWESGVDEKVSLLELQNVH